MKKSLFLTIALLILSTGLLSAAVIMQDECNYDSAKFYTFCWDQMNVSAGDVAITGGLMNFSGTGTKVIVGAVDAPTNKEVSVDVMVNANTGFFTTGLDWRGPSQDSSIDCDLYYDSDGAGAWKIGLYQSTGSVYQASAALSPALTTGTLVRIVATRNNETFTVSAFSLPALTQLATTSYTYTGLGLADFAPFGPIILKCDGAKASVDSVTVKDGSGNTIFSDTFDDGFYPNWYAEATNDVAGVGMNCFNFNSVKILQSRPDFVAVPGFFAIRGVADFNYSRATTRYAPNAPSGLPYLKNYFGNCDIRVKVNFPDISPDDGYFELGLRNKCNECGRWGVALFPSNTGQTNGVDNPSLHIANNCNYAGIGGIVDSVSLKGKIDFSTDPDCYIFVKMNGNDIQAFAGNSSDATNKFAFSTIWGTGINTPNTSGQLVLAVGKLDPVLVDEITVWDADTGFGSSSVEDWTIFK